MGEESNQNMGKPPKKRDPDRKRRILSIIGKELRNYCGKHQFGVLITVVILFVIFLIAVIGKNFFGNTEVVIELYDKQFVIGHINNGIGTSIVLSLIEIATLPFLILNLMFSAQGSFENSQHDDSVDLKINALDKGIEKANKDINHNNEDIKIIRACLEQFKDEIVEEVKKSNKINTPNPPTIKGNNEISEDKNGEINPDK